jgi:hypothetical protein
LPPGYTNNWFNTILIADDIIEQYPTAAYIRLSGAKVDFTTNSYPYIIYPHIKELTKSLYALESSFNSWTLYNRNIFVNLANNQTLDTVLASVPERLRAYVKIVVFRDSSKSGYFRFFEFYSTSD